MNAVNMAGNKLWVEKKELKFPYDIEQIAWRDDKLFVMVEVWEDRNLYCVDRNTLTVDWQISGLTDPIRKFDHLDGKLTVTTAAGDVREIDLATGKVLSRSAEQVEKDIEQKCNDVESFHLMRSLFMETRDIMKEMLEDAAYDDDPADLLEKAFDAATKTVGSCTVFGEDGCDWRGRPVHIFRVSGPSGVHEDISVSDEVNAWRVMEFLADKAETMNKRIEFAKEGISEFEKELAVAS